MPKLPALKPKQVIRALEKAGFKFVRSHGSHRIFLKSTRAVTLPYHSRALKKGTLRAIIKQSGLSVEDFLKLV